MAENLYADLDQWERRFSYDVDVGAADRTELEQVIQTASRDVDDMCHTHFFTATGTRILDGSGLPILIIPDLVAVTSIKLDEDRDRVFETILAGTDYYLTRPNHERPYEELPKRLITLDAFNGSFSTFMRQEQLVQIVAEWGYTLTSGDTKVVAGETVQDGTEQDATQTTLDVNDGTEFSIGQTLKIEDEQEYVEGIATNQLTVGRAKNGTTATTHANGTAISKYTYLPKVIDATLIQAVRLWKRKELAFVSREGALQEGFDEDAMRLVSEFVRYDQ